MTDERPSRDQECVRFLQWALPRMGYRWAGFRKVRRQVCRRVVRRVAELELDSLAAYRALLETQESEWPRLDDCCRITISRFYRDRRFWEVLGSDVLPELCRRGAAPLLRAWSAGCGAGEEPYTLAMALRFERALADVDVETEIVATDLEPVQLERARRAVYPEASLRELPGGWREEAFDPTSEGQLRLKGELAAPVRLLHQDIRSETPDGPFDLILCRNLVFMYLDAPGRAAGLERLLAVLAPEGWLGVGSHDELPPSRALTPHPSGVGLFRLATARGA
jgi:chemotaxis protein methyltransferase CheR